ncbi:alkaline phosphatase family protein [Reyranella sp.]|uniref:alkaline phosphatase family protein n=1 Tax=Reyranella sp. TaxID=1929291 RepID=UPI003BA919A2
MVHKRSSGRRAVFVCFDGLGASWLSAGRTPALRALAMGSLVGTDHRAVFPSVTRVSAASIATGCHPARHGLHGNRMALAEGKGFTVRDVGPPDFRDHMRRATGGTLRVPTLAERTAAAGGFVAFSNVSPGVAYFLDPEHFGHVYHRAGSFAPGGDPIAGAKALTVSHDLAGDRAMTERFCEEVLRQRSPAVTVLWLANPDLTLHGAPLGSPQHLEALEGADACVARVATTIEALRRDGEDVLLAVGSDHGQETIGACVDIDDWLGRHGLAAEIAAGEIAVAGQGTAALLYATTAARPRLEGVLERLRDEPWVDELVAAHDLARLGHAASGGIVAAVNMARSEEANPYGVRGRRWTVAEPGKPASIGWGQHGGWGADETRPFLMLNAAGLAPGVLGGATSLVDVAPTLLDFVGLPSDGMDGRSLLQRRTSCG